MRPLLLFLLACATLSTCALVSTPGSAQASTGVARCAMPDGTYAYTNVSCGRLGGRHVALPVDVQNRILGELRREALKDGAPLPAAEGLLAGLPSRGTQRPRGRGCATSPRQLAADLRASMAQGDVNRIAESFDWAGMSHEQAMRMMARIQRLGGVSLLGAEFFGSGRGGDQYVATGGTLQVVLQDQGGPRVADFDVRRDGGCYFLQHASSA